VTYVMSGSRVRGINNRQSHIVAYANATSGSDADEFRFAVIV